MSDVPTGRRRRDDIITISDTPNRRKPMYSYEELRGCVKAKLSFECWNKCFKHFIKLQSIFGSTTCSTFDRSVKRWSISLASKPKTILNQHEPIPDSARNEVFRDKRLNGYQLKWFDHERNMPTSSFESKRNCEFGLCQPVHLMRNEDRSK
ncbi:hypothetical protein YC2023_090487 [Brassica napus]